MARIMYDSVDANAIPTNAQMVAGYVDGTSFRWSLSDWNRFPNSVKVRIARRTSTNDGHVLDVEAGIPTVWPLTDPAVRQGIRNWVAMRRAAGTEPTVYCNQLNDWQAVRDVFRQAGMREPLYWVARYNNVREIPAGAIAKQYANPPLAGGHYDLSFVANHWPGVDSQENEMELADKVPVKMADGQTYQISVADVLAGLAQYIGAHGGIPGTSLTAHAKGQYWDRIISLSNINDGVQTLLTDVGNLSIEPVDVPTLATALVERIGPDTATLFANAVADEIDRRARDNDPTTGPTS